jgi:hypothetical protein
MSNLLTKDLSTVRQAHRPELIEGLREHYQASLCVVYVTVFANRSTKDERNEADALKSNTDDFPVV